VASGAWFPACNSCPLEEYGSNMLRYVKMPQVRRYRVEVSGWDREQNFFVENSDLLWAEESGKVVSLHRALSPEAILFVRLLDPEQADRSHPVVYQAKWLGEAADRSQQFQLSALVPRTPENSVV
jgi:hypothetical protein